jgi:hypothetical protein
MLGFIKLISGLNKYGIQFRNNVFFYGKLELGIRKYVRFQVLTAASMKMAVFWIVAPCSLVDDRPDDVGSKHL